MPHVPGHLPRTPENAFDAFISPTPQVVPPVRRTNQPGPVGPETSFLQNPLVGFLPVAGTAAHWNQMGPWEKALSVGLDAVDLATLGGGKAVTAPIRAATNFATRGDPALTFLRMGTMPQVSGPYPDIRELDALLGSVSNPMKESQARKTMQDIYDANKELEKIELQLEVGPRKAEQILADRANKLPSENVQFGPSRNWATGEFEPGISTYQGLRFPWDESEGINLFMRPLETEGGSGGQNLMWNRGKWDRDLFEVEGTPLRTLGSDSETLLDPNTVQYSRLLYPGDVVYSNTSRQSLVPAMESFVEGRQAIPSNFIQNPVTGETINLSKQFSKFDATGRRSNPFLNLEETIDPYLTNKMIPSHMGTLGYTAPVRAGMDIHGGQIEYSPTLKPWERIRW